MWLMLQQDKPDDYVIATNETHSVREFLEIAFGHVGLELESYVEIDPTLLSPRGSRFAHRRLLQGQGKLGWEPKTRFADLVKLMVDADMQRLRDHREGRVKVTD